MRLIYVLDSAQSDNISYLSFSIYITYILSIVFNHNGKKPEMNKSTESGNFTSMWKLSLTQFVNNQWAKENIKK